MAACLFCEIVAGRAPGSLVYRDAEVTAFRDVRPQAPTHILVVPNEHFASLAEVGEEQGALLGQMVAIANRLAVQEGIARSGYRLVINNGPDAGQSVGHLHLHLLGGRAFRWPPG